MVLLKSLVSWIVYVLPEFSTLILTFVGIMMAVPSFAKRLENDKRFRIAIALLCVLFGFAGFVNSVIQKYKSDNDTRTLVTNTNKLVVSTEKEVANTNNLVTSVSDILLRLDGLTRQISRVDSDIKASKGDSSQTAILHARKDELEKQRDEALQDLNTALLSPERLNEITKDTIKEMTDGESQMAQAITNIAQNEQDGSTTREDGDRAEASIFAGIQSSLRHTVIRACALRNEILSDTLLTPAQRKQLADNENDGRCARLRSGDYTYSDLVHARAHLSQLQQALQSNLPLR
jgi:hypothetical protein